MENTIARHNLPSPLSVTSVFSIYHANTHTDATDHKFSYSFTELTYLPKNSASYTVVLDDKMYTLNTGQILFFPPNSEHSNHLPTNAIVYTITFDVDFPEINKLYNRVITLNGRQIQQLEQVVAIGLRLLENIPQKGYTIGNSLHSRANPLELQKFKNLFELFLIDLYLTEESSINAAIYRFPDDKKLDELISYLKRNIDKPLTVDELSKATLISVAKIRKLFYKKHTCAPMQYFNQLKLKAAIELICNTSLRYSEIAAHLGFSDATYFSKFFKNKTGMSPSEYVKSLKSSK